MIHLVYPHGLRVSTPDAIGRHLSEQLRARGYEVANHDWAARYRIVPKFGDILLGHPHPWPDTVFRRSFKELGWSKRLLLCPYAHGAWRQIDWMDPLVRRCDAFLAITGPFWAHSLQSSRFSHWASRFVHVDLAVCTADFPRIKVSFNAPHRRRFVYIGHVGWPKNTEYLSKLALSLPHGTVAHIGAGIIPGCVELGTMDFREGAARERLVDFDFMLTVGESDANPTTILEAMSWGLVPVCTPESGYAGVRGIPNIPLNSSREALRQLHALQTVSTDTIEGWRNHNDEALRTHYTWQRFSNQVVGAIESPQSSGPQQATGLVRSLSLLTGTLTCPYGLAHPRNLARWLKQTPERWTSRSDS